MTSITHRTMTPADLDWALGLAAQEGWNPGHDDAAPFLTSDPDGFFVADVDAAPAAVISVVNHDPGTAFLGLYICHPGFRGRGVGFGLWHHALRHAGTRTVGLDGVPDQEANYAKSGFALAGRTHRFDGFVPPLSSDLLRQATAQDSDTLTVIEARANGFTKAAFIAAWTRATPTRRTLVLDRGVGPEGFATIRACRIGHKIGPLVAHSAEDAVTLLHGIAALAGDTDVIVDVPDDNTDMARYCEGLGMTVSFSTARMYRGPAPTPGTRHRTIATLELG